MTEARVARIRFASINAPERTDPSKRRLLAPVRRARGILRWLQAEGVTVAVLQETGSIMEAAVLRMAAHSNPRWRYSPAPPNTVIRGHELGNAIITRRKAIRIRDRRSINVPLQGRKRGLWLPERLLEHKATGALFNVIGVHKARAKGVPGGGPSRAASDRLVAAHATAAVEAGFPTIPAGDWNGAPAKIAGFTTAIRHLADAILASIGISSSDGHSHQLTGLTDHHAITVDLAIQVTTTTEKRLPAVKESA